MFPVLFVGIVGLCAGIVLAFASKKLHTLRNAKIDRLRDILPDINCGACGYQECAAYAKAVVEGKAEPDGCSPGGPKTAHAVADILGVTIDVAEPKMAVVHCRGGLKEALERSVYDGIQDCHAATVAGYGSKACPDGCLGLGSCVRVCPFNALSITAGKVAVVDPEKCNGCGKCIKACPRGIIELIPRVHKIFLACSSHDFGLKVKKYCTVGCTGCALCITCTPSGAISMGINLPVLDYTQEENFIVAVNKCPSRCIVDLIKARPLVNIDSKCDGCGECVLCCPVAAIAGEKGMRYVVDKDKCIGCGLCLNKCHVHAITLWGGLGYEQKKIGRWRK